MSGFDNIRAEPPRLVALIHLISGLISWGKPLANSISRTSSMRTLDTRDVPIPKVAEASLWII